MRTIILVVLATIYLSGEAAFAYASDIYGHGVYGGAQSCGYGGNPSQTFYDKDFDYRELKDEIKELQKELKDKTREFSYLKRDLKDYKKDSDYYLKPFAAQQVVSHIENQKNSDDYRGGDDKVTSPACNNGSGVASEFCKPDPVCSRDANYAAENGCHKVGDNYEDKRDRWTNSYTKGYQSGYLSDAICNDMPAKVNVNQDRCKKWLNNYMKDQKRFFQLQTEVDTIKDTIKEKQRDLARRKRDIKREVEDGTFVETADDKTEAEDCPTCSWYSKNSDTIRLIAGIGLPILGAYLGYRGAQSISEQNARLGWPTSPYMASGLAYPFIMQGLYGGIMGGLSAGGFGCSGGYYGGAMGPYGMMGMGGLFGTGLYGGMGGAFGYPGYMYGAGPWGAGPYMPGMGPWGIPGPYMGGGFPMGGMMIGGAIGGVIGMAAGGFPYGGGYPVAGYPMGMPMGGAIGGAIGMMMGGYPMGMMMGGYPMGMPVGGAIGGAMGYPMGGYPMGMPVGGAIGGAMGYPMGGYPMGAMIGGAIGGAMGYPLAGYPMGGMMGGYPMGGYMMGGAIGGAMGYPMGGYMMGGAMGMPMGGYMMGGAMGMPMGGAIGGAMGMPMGGYMMGGAQMQQQYMNQYMQMMQYQMQMQQEQMQKQQIIGRLTQELYKIQMQIQQISSGAYYGGSYPYSVAPGYGPPGTGGPVATTPNTPGGGGSPIRSR